MRISRLRRILWYLLVVGLVLYLLCLMYPFLRPGGSVLLLQPPTSAVLLVPPPKITTTAGTEAAAATAAAVAVAQLPRLSLEEGSVQQQPYGDRWGGGWRIQRQSATDHAGRRRTTNNQKADLPANSDPKEEKDDDNNNNKQKTTVAVTVLEGATTTSRRSKYAYAFVIGGCYPEDGRYRGFVYNIVVATYILRRLGSTADVVIFVQIGYRSSFSALPLEDVRLLEAMNVRIRYLPKSDLESFYDTALSKFNIVQLTEYRRVLLLDSDAMPVTNLDYLFQLSDGNNAVLKENVVVDGLWEPCNGGFFMLQPGNGYIDEINAIIKKREMAHQHVTGNWARGHQFDEVTGWGHVITPPDQWVGRKAQGTNWTFHFAFSDQGLLYYWTKYYQKSVSIIGKNYRVENWASGENGTVQLQEVLDNPLQNLSKPIIKDRETCRKFLCDYVHFSGNTKPWLSRPLEVNDETMLTNATYLWWYTLRQLNDELKMNLNFSNWQLIAQTPSLGMYAKFSDMDRRANRANNITTNHDA